MRNLKKYNELIKESSGDYDEGKISNLKDLIENFYNRSGIEVEISSFDYDLKINIDINKTEKISNLLKIFDITNRVKLDLLGEYESEFDIITNKNRSYISFNFYY